MAVTASLDAAIRGRTARCILRETHNALLPCGADAPSGPAVNGSSGAVGVLEIARPGAAPEREVRRAERVRVAAGSGGDRRCLGEARAPQRCAAFPAESVPPRSERPNVRAHRWVEHGSRTVKPGWGSEGSRRRESGSCAVVTLLLRGGRGMSEETERAREHVEVAEHWASRGHLSYAAAERNVAVEHASAAAAGTSPLPELSQRVEQHRRQQRSRKRSQPLP